jgi:hypothetical protein
MINNFQNQASNAEPVGGNLNPYVWSMIKRLGSDLAQRSSRDEFFAVLDRNSSLKAAAKELDPSSHSRNAEIAARIVAFAARILDEAALEDIVQQHINANTHRIVESSRKRTRAERSEGHVKAGMRPWPLQEEEDQLFKLIENPDFQFPAGSRLKGYPDYKLIALALNAQFHNEMPYREADECKIKVRNVRTKRRKDDSSLKLMRPTTFWAAEEECILVTYCTDAEYLHKKGPAKDKPDFNRIATKMKGRSRKQCSSHWKSIRDNPEKKSELEAKTGRVIPESKKTIDWSLLDELLLRLAKEYVHPKDHQHADKPNCVEIAQKLQVQYPDQPTITSGNVSARLKKLQK